MTFSLILVFEAVATIGTLVLLLLLMHTRRLGQQLPLYKYNRIIVTSVPLGNQTSLAFSGSIRT